jgi:hypothetical protein
MSAFGQKRTLGGQEKPGTAELLNETMRRISLDESVSSLYLDGPFFSAGRFVRTG